MTKESGANMTVWKWRILLATMACYLFYYCGRLNLSICMKPISEEFGWDVAQMGLLATVFTWSYGIGQFFNGNMADRFGRVLMPIGAVISCAANWAFSYAPTAGQTVATALGWANVTGLVFFLMGAIWSVNAYFQAMGMGPGGRLISNWWAHRERGMAMGFYTFAAAMSNVTVFILASAAAGYWGWRAAFRYPVLLMAVVAIGFYLVTKDHPEDVGLESPHETPPKGEKPSTSVGRYAAALSNRDFMLASLSIALHHVARWGLLTFIPTFFMETYGWKIKSAGFVASALPLGMAFGALSGGFISDWVFRGRRNIVIAVSLVLCAICIVVLPMMAGGTVGSEAGPSAAAKINAALILVVSGYMLYLCIGPYFSLPADLLGPQTAGTGIGLMDAFAYGGAGTGIAIAGMLIKHFGYSVGFYFMAACAILGAVTVLLVREPVETPTPAEVEE